MSTDEIAILWDLTERGEVSGLTDSELVLLHRWCDEHEVALPPAGWVSEEMVARGLDREGDCSRDRVVQHRRR